MLGDGLLKPLADQPPGFGDQVAQWVGPGQGSVRGALQRQQANLGAVAVHDHHLVVPGECGKRPGDMRYLVDLGRGVGSLTSPQQGVPAANAAWLSHAVIAFNVARASGVAAGAPKIRWATLRNRVINTPPGSHRPAVDSCHRADLNIGPTPDQGPQWKNRISTGRSTALICKSTTHTQKIKPPEPTSVDQGSVLPRRDRRCQTERQTRPVFREVTGPANKRRADK